MPREGRHVMIAACCGPVLDVAGERGACGCRACGQRRDRDRRGTGGDPAVAARPACDILEGHPVHLGCCAVQ